MRLHLLILLFVTIPVVEPQYSTGVRLQLTTGSNQPVKKLMVTVRIETLEGLRCPLETQVITDDEGVAIIGLFGSRCRLHLETSGFDDYTVDVTVKENEITPVAAHLEPVEEVSFERLPAEQVNAFANACRQSASLQTRISRSSFDNEQEWSALWSELNLAAPTVDFKKWRVVISVVPSSVYLGEIKIRRITYNPTRKLISVRRDFPAAHGEVFAQVISCTADMVLIPPHDGAVMFR